MPSRRRGTSACHTRGPGAAERRIRNGRAAAPRAGEDGTARRLRLVFAFIAIVPFIACVRPPAPEPVPARPAPAPAAEVAPPPPGPPPPDPLGLPCPAVVRLEVRKRARVLEAECNGGGRRVFPIALSREPIGAKQRRGDQRIPEGSYHLRGRARASRFHLFLPIDYPSPADADRGLLEGLISRSEHRRIFAAHAAGRMPPQDTALGGLLGFHGEGPRWRGDLDLDWTEGCVAVEDAVIRWLAKHAKPGTPVEIRP